MTTDEQIKLTQPNCLLLPVRERDRGASRRYGLVTIAPISCRTTLPSGRHASCSRRPRTRNPIAAATAAAAATQWRGGEQRSVVEVYSITHRIALQFRRNWFSLSTISLLCCSFSFKVCREMVKKVERSRGILFYVIKKMSKPNPLKVPKCFTRNSMKRSWR